jgi:hypothetical protein
MFGKDPHLRSARLRVSICHSASLNPCAEGKEEKTKTPTNVLQRPASEVRTAYIHSTPYTLRLIALHASEVRSESDTEAFARP